jgi:hypothetical protein
VSFVPSQYSLEDLTVSPTADSRGLSNQPESGTHLRNMALLTRFLKSLPFRFRLNSAYRSPSVNQAVGGSASSQHPNGLAADITPEGMSNRDLAAWLWVRKDEYPELDQVIWYTGTSHVHIGVCPPGAQSCPARQPRQQFYKAGSEGSGYVSWMPGLEERSAISRRFPQGRPLSLWVWALGGTALVGGAAGFAYWWFKVRR